MLLWLSLLNMPEYASVCLNKQHSECASGLKYAKLLNIVKSWIWRGSQFASITQCSDMSEYALTEFWIYLGVLYMQELIKVLNISQYGWVCLNRMWICLNTSEFTIIDRSLNMYHTIHSARPLCKLMNTDWEIKDLRSKI